jgi:hypothetical protein
LASRVNRIAPIVIRYSNNKQQQQQATLSNEIIITPGKLKILDILKDKLSLERVEQLKLRVFGKNVDLEPFFHKLPILPRLRCFSICAENGLLPLSASLMTNHLTPKLKSVERLVFEDFFHDSCWRKGDSPANIDVQKLVSAFPRLVAVEFGMHGSGLAVLVPRNISTLIDVDTSTLGYMLVCGDLHSLDVLHLTVQCLDELPNLAELFAYYPRQVRNLQKMKLTLLQAFSLNRFKMDFFGEQCQRIFAALPNLEKLAIKIHFEGYDEAVVDTSDMFAFLSLLKKLSHMKVWFLCNQTYSSKQVSLDASHFPSRLTNLATQGCWLTDVNPCLQLLSYSHNFEIEDHFGTLLGHLSQMHHLRDLKITIPAPKSLPLAECKSALRRVVPPSLKRMELKLTLTAQERNCLHKAFLETRAKRS